MKNKETYEYFQQHADTKSDEDRSPEEHLDNIGDFLLKQYGPAARIKVMDIGCFKGWSSSYLKRNFAPVATMIGVDFIEHDLQKIRLDDFCNVDLTSGELKEKIQSVDFAFCLRTAPFFETNIWSQIVKDIHETLKPKGHFICQEFVWNEAFPNDEKHNVLNDPGKLIKEIRPKDEILDVYKQAGFEVLEENIPAHKHGQYYQTGLFLMRKPA